MLFALKASFLLLAFVPPSKKELHKLFIRKADEFSPASEWYAKNDDSCFYKSDTIRFYNAASYLYHSNNSCNFVKWHFSKRKHVSLTTLRLCQEPPVSTAMRDDYFSYSIRKKQRLTLTISNKKKQAEFEIIDLSETEFGTSDSKCYVLTLVRRKQP